MKKGIFCFSALLVLGALAYVGVSGLPGGAMELRVALPARGSISSHVAATGTVISRDELTINSPVSGRLREVRVGEGDEVKAGAVLATFDPREHAPAIHTAAAALDSARHRLQFAVRERDSLEKVFQVGGESRRVVEEAELRVIELRDERSAAEQGVRQARWDMDKLTVTAPRASLVTARLARAGTWIRAGDPLFKLAPGDTREIEARLDASDSAIAAVGKAVSVSSDAHPDTPWQERITWVAPATARDAAANTLSVRISLGRAAPALALGQQVDVKFTSESRDDALQLPSNAIIADQGEPRVAVLDKGRVRFKPVTTGIESASMTEIRGGLAPGEQVLIPEGRALREGDRARIVGGAR